jgi:hypothetical protein
MNDSSNPGADFHCAPNSIIKLKGEDLPQPRNGAPTTSDAYVSQLRTQTGELFNDGVVNFTSTNRNALQDSGDAINLGTGEFTVEAFVYHSDIPQNSLQYIFMNSSQSNTTTFAFAVESDRIVAGAFAGSFSNSTKVEATFPVGSLKTGKWYHYAACRSGNTLRLFIDGRMVVEDTSHTENYNNTSAFGCRVGCEAGAGATAAGFKAIKGFISNVRVVNGTALYTSNFTPPTSALTAVTNTVLLCCQSPSSPTAAAVSPGTLSVLTEGDGLTAGRNELDASIVLAVPGISTATGVNLVTNGHFDTDTSGWSSFSSATLTQVNGTLKVECTGGDTVSAGSYNFATVNGQRYTVSVEVISRTGTTELGISNNSTVGAGANILSTNDGSASLDLGLNSRSFTATGTTTYIGLWTSGIANAANTNAIYDNVVVKQEDAPRDYSADIKGSGTNKTLTATGNAGVGYDLGGYYGSAMTFDGTGDFLSIPNNSDFNYSDGGDFTIELWLYRKNTGGNDAVIGVFENSVARRGWQIEQRANEALRFQWWADGSTGSGTLDTPTSAVPIDQWTHICAERNGDLVTLYINGVASAVDTSAGSFYNNTVDPLRIGVLNAAGDSDLNANIQDVRIYKGLAKYKGGFDVPKPYTPVGIEAFRTTDDTCKNNFATLNPLDEADMPVSNGNLAIDQSSGGWHTLLGTQYVSSGKWYAEMRMDRLGWIMFGVDQTWLETNSKHIGGQTGSKGMAVVYNTGSRGDITYNGANSVYTGGDTTAATGDIISIALDLDNNNVKFFKNNVQQYNLDNLLESGEQYSIGASPYSNVAITINFGQNPTFSGALTAGTNADDSGKGLFKYAPPSGFLALCEDNLPAPAIADPGKHFKTVLWSGDGNSGRNITGVGFKPDLVWIKRRDGADVRHYLFDLIRGPLKGLDPSDGIAEVEGSTWLQSFDSNGFSLGSSGGLNGSGNNYVAWCWKAGGPAVTNTEGNITTQVSANPEAGFSIIRSPGPGTSGHGLNSTPKFIIQKSVGTGNWNVAHADLYASGGTGKILLNLNGGVVASSTTYMHEATATTFDPLFSADQMAYVWAEVENFSKFGSYIGNENADGSFIYCGFKPAFVITKRIDGNGNWLIHDSSRDPVNPVMGALYANEPDPEGSAVRVDFVSNGFKHRNADGGTANNYANNYIFAAFAESPFQTANAK